MKNKNLNYQNMKKIYFILCSFLLLTSCGNNNSRDRMDLELREKQLELKERELAIQRTEEREVMLENDNQTPTSNSKRNVSQESKYSQQKPKEKSTEELRQELYLKEKNNPREFLSLDYSLTYKVLSGEDKITGNIYNNATMATFKDVVVTVSYTTSTGTSLGSNNYIIYDYVYPSSSTTFTIKTYSPEGTKQIGVNVKSAKAE
jgi:hypothetical protein